MENIKKYLWISALDPIRDSLSDKVRASNIDKTSAYHLNVHVINSVREISLRRLYQK